VTVSNLRLMSELLRVSTIGERGSSPLHEDYDTEARLALAASERPLITPLPCRLTEEGARIVGELLATFEEQT
jgi:hypothetical protein